MIESTINACVIEQDPIKNTTHYFGAVNVVKMKENLASTIKNIRCTTVQSFCVSRCLHCDLCYTMCLEHICSNSRLCFMKRRSVDVFGRGIYVYESTRYRQITMSIFSKSKLNTITHRISFEFFFYFPLSPRFFSHPVHFSFFIAFFQHSHFSLFSLFFSVCLLCLHLINKQNRNRNVYTQSFFSVQYAREQIRYN